MTRLLDTLERAAWTFVEAFAASVVLTNSLGSMDFKIAGGAAVIAVLKTLAINTNVRGQLDVLKALTPTRKAK